jgi:hypothetical protein
MKAAQAVVLILTLAASVGGAHERLDRPPGRAATMAQGQQRPASKARARGPLRVHPTNPRYFTDGSGRAIYLTGSHLGWELQDHAWGREITFDYPHLLDFLREHNHNLIRMWVVEHPKGSNHASPPATPMPYRRTGPGKALDGGLKFDLRQFDPAYFRRLRSRTIMARDRGIYVAVMLFQGWSIERRNSEDPWFGHPFNPANNVNGINGDASGDTNGEEVHTLAIPAVTRLQEAYVRKVIDTVNDLDNVLYEITNESPISSKEWQYHMVRTIQRYEASKRKQHPVGMSYFADGRAGAMAALLASPADWIAPGNDGRLFEYGDSPPAADGRKVIISDSDHFWGVNRGDPQWVWKSFLRGLNLLYMDAYDGQEEVTRINAPKFDPRWEPVRKAMGHTLTMARRVNLAAMVPRGDLASSGYCLADPGKEYLVYLPSGGEGTVDLSAAARDLVVEWLHPVEGTITPGGKTAGGAKRAFTAPFSGDAILYIHRTANASG